MVVLYVWIYGWILCAFWSDFFFCSAVRASYLSLSPFTLNLCVQSRYFRFAGAVSLGHSIAVASSAWCDFYARNFLLHHHRRNVYSGWRQVIPISAIACAFLILHINLDSEAFSTEKKINDCGSASSKKRGQTSFLFLFFKSILLDFCLQGIHFISILTIA